MAVHGAPASSADAVLEHVVDGHDLIVPTANGEPVTLLDALEAGAAEGPPRPPAPCRRVR